MKPAPNKKQLVIRPLKLKPQLPADFESTNWDRLADAVRAVQSARPVACSLEELYHAVENLCVHNLAAKVYPQLQALCDSHAAATVAGLASRASLDAAAFLDHVGRAWEDYCAQILLIRQIFLYMDRTYVMAAPPPQTAAATTFSAATAPPAARSVYDMGLQLFRSHLGAHPDVERKLIDGLLGAVDAERGGEATDRALLARLLRMLSALGTYADAFQWPFLDQAARYFSAEGERLAGELPLAGYAAHCERRLAEECARADAYLEPTTRAPLVAAVEAGLIEAHVGRLVGPGLDALLAADAWDDAAAVHGLCARVGALRPLCAAFKAHVQRVGAEIVLAEGPAAEGDMVPALLRLKSRMDEAVSGAFGGNPSFVNALKEGFESFINQRANKPAELLAKYMDAALRGGARGPAGADGEVEASVDAALVLFRFIQGKDVFEAFYKKDLAKRLLLGRSASVEAEKAAISKLKAECGSQFTSKLEGMFKDVELSRDAANAFKRDEAAAAALAAAAPGVDLGVHVLTSGFWPTYPALDCALPPPLAAAQAAFADFYLAKHSGRRLSWVNALGTCLLRAHFPGGDKELAVSAFQAVVLLQFNDAERLTLAEVAAATALEDRELRRTLQSLACGRERVLLKEPAGREVGDGDSFAFNAQYTSRLYRVRVNAIQARETPEEARKTNEGVMQDRQYQVDAAIVRIMKTRKTLGHKLLVNELVAQLRFPVAGPDLKKRIESLIEREYVERDPDDPQVYNYLA
jgi:cullin-4